MKSQTIKSARARSANRSGRIVRHRVYDARMTQERHDGDVKRRGRSDWGTVRAGSWHL